VRYGKSLPSPKKGTPIDYLSFVPDGEPTLDDNAGNNIDLLRSLGIKIAVITNGSPLNCGDIRQDLEKADLVSLKIDAVRKMTWLRTNRPHRSSDLRAIAAKGVSSADDQTLTMAYQIFRENVPRVEYLADYEENEFGFRRGSRCQGPLRLTSPISHHTACTGTRK
jgi:wyosine [tRNA(Phe)-imidazoG37] synthetase (radical SAM superfamily)